MFVFSGGACGSQVSCNHKCNLVLHVRGGASGAGRCGVGSATLAVHDNGPPHPLLPHHCLLLDPLGERALATLKAQVR